MFDIGKTKARLIATGLLMMAMGLGCNDSDSISSSEDDAPAASATYASDRPILSIQMRRDEVDAENRIADIVFKKPSTREGPRVAEILLKYSDGLTYLSSVKGAALDASNKTLIAQTPENGSLRLVVYGADNANVIDGGIIASVTFKYDNSNVNTLEILTKKPIFAPGAANDGLLVDDPVVVD